MGTRADRLLCCAVAYHEYIEEPSVQPKLPSQFRNERDAIDAMMRVLWFEAHHSMQATIPPPEDAYMHAVDIGSTEPGIVTSHKKPDILRRKLPLPRVVYEKRESRPQLTVQSVEPAKSREEALQHAVERELKAAVESKRDARREMKADEKSLERLEKRDERKRQRDAETSDERDSRLQEQRATRDLKKLAKMEEEATRALAKQHADASSEGEAPGDESACAVDTPPPPVHTADGAVPVVVNLDDALETDASVEVKADHLMPERVRARGSKTLFYPSPIPFDRHLSALEAAGLHDSVRDSVLYAKPSSHVRIIHGPPGTGKTRHLAAMINAFGNDRILACAPTNVGAANLYARVLSYCEDASLVMPMSRVPANTPVVSQSPHARVVCCTISGRAGHVLDDEQFGVVIVDEAAQCMEAWVWCLLRPEVHTIIMAGDTHQLPALTSEEGGKRHHDRSLMQRLMDSGYPAEFLDTQHRMHPEIVAFPNRTFYDSQLLTQYNAHETFEHRPYEVVNVEGECRRIGTSYCNRCEIDCCIKLQTKLASTLEHVVIISPYQAQTRALLAAGARNVHTIDSFQGHEADAVIISVVRHDDIGFWSDYRRLNVALTRARHCARIVGASRLWTGLLRQLADDAAARNLIA